MEARARKLVAAGVEPVDELLGGLEQGCLYLIHGDAAGKSLFGIKFLIEGLKRGESGALVIRYSPEDAVRRFARLGYDCLEDIYSGRLIILEYTSEIVQQIAGLREITPVLRELEWLLGEAKPHRIIFDPVAHLVLSEKGDLLDRVRAFADWAASFGATTVLVANGEEQEVVKYFRPLVRESFRFEVKEISERATRFFVFEKSPSIPDQAIEVDPSRGVFLLGRAQERFATRFKVGPPSIKIDLPELEETEPPPSASERSGEIDTDLPHTKESSGSDVSEREVNDISLPGDERLAASKPESEDSGERSETPNVPSPDKRPSERSLFESNWSNEEQSDPLSDLLDDLAGIASPIDLDEIEQRSVAYDDAKARPASAPQAAEFPARSDLQTGIESDESPLSLLDQGRDLSEEEMPSSRPAVGEYDQAPSESVESSPAQGKGGSGRTASEGSPITRRAVEILLHPPETGEETFSTHIPAALPTPRESPVSQEAVNPKDFNVLVIDDNPMSCELTAQELGDYTVEVVHDGVSGLAKLISFKPDLVILNVDLPIIDGFKILAHIRSSLNMPIMIISGAHMRASDRVLAAELGADHYMTKPVNVKELRQKARHLIARYRNISSWIITSHTGAEPRAPRAGRKTDRTGVPPGFLTEADNERFTPYQNFVSMVETSVKAAIDSGSSFSIVGCCLPDMTSNGAQKALRLFELVRSLVRETDLISTNSRNDLVVFLADADGTGAQAFMNRLRERVTEEMKEEPSLWLRSFPDIEEAVEPTFPNFLNANGKSNRRAEDKSDEEER
ncbi:MAG: response regulator [Blastocatellia bacterium]|nr:response regulator [Blastocatellia bacterium]